MPLPSPQAALPLPGRAGILRARLLASPTGAVRPVGPLLRAGFLGLLVAGLAAFAVAAPASVVRAAGPSAETASDPVPRGSSGPRSAGVSAADPGWPEWKWPVAPPHVVVAPFVAPATAYSAGHRGVDLAGESGTVVMAPAAGVVHFVGTVVDRPVLSIRHPDGLLSSFEPVTSELSEGDVVLAGEPVGMVSGTHRGVPALHLGVRLRGQYISPMNLLGGIPPPVLLPTRSLK